MRDIEVALLTEKSYAAPEQPPVGTYSLSVPGSTSLGEIKLSPPEMLADTMRQDGSRGLALELLARPGLGGWMIALLESGTKRFHLVWELDVLGPHGEILFNQPIEDTTLAELHGVAEAGLLPFDLNPAVIGLWCPEGLGNGDELPFVLQYWSDFNFWLATIVASAIGSHVAECAKALRNVIGRRWHEYRDRKASPGDVMRQILQHCQWDVGEFAVRFRVDREEARELLTALGYSPSESRIDYYVASHRASEAAIAQQIQDASYADSPDIVVESLETMVLEYPQIRALLELDEFEPDRDSSGPWL